MDSKVTARADQGDVLKKTAPSGSRDTVGTPPDPQIYSNGPSNSSKFSGGDD